MAKIKPISKVKQTSKSRSTVSRLNPILGYPMQKQKSAPIKTVHTKEKSRSLKEVYADIKRYLKFFGKGVTVATALKFSLKEDIERARTQLRAVYITGLRTGVFRFRVKSSGVYANTPNSYKVDVQWVTDGLIGNKDAEYIFKHAPIKAQCTCGRHTYWYRYLWTKAGASLGVQEHRFPSVRNKDLKGMCCKHMIKTLELLEKSHFQVTFNRYITNLEQDKRTLISHKDKVKIAGASFKK